MEENGARSNNDSNAPSIRLGLRPNINQFSILVVVNAFVGAIKILSSSNNKNPIWHEETSPSAPSKMTYPYRWEADLIADHMDITTDKIFEFEPFRSDKKIFSLLIRNRHPRSLNSPQYDEFRNFLLSKCDSMKVHEFTNINEERRQEKYIILRTQPLSAWGDKEGQEYHYGTNVPRHAQLTPGSYVIFDRNTDGQIEYTGCAKISSVREEDKGRKTSEGRPVFDKVASLQDYLKFNPPVIRDSQIQKMVESIPNYNNQHSIRLITKEIFEMITKNKGSNQKLASLGNWFSLSSTDIEEVIKEVLDRDGIRLEIEPEIVKRIINHLIASKNVILVGPPGTVCDWYILEPGKGFAYHNQEFINGYIDGFCDNSRPGRGSDADEASFNCR